MSERPTPDLLADILTVTDRRRLSRLMGVGERIVYRWEDGTAEPRAERRQRLERLATLARDFRRIARGEPTAEELVV